MTPVVLPPCPSAPHCVCSVQDSQDSHYIAPLRVGEKMASDNSKTEAAKVLAKLVQILRSEFSGSVTVVSQSETSVKVEFRSSIFGFVDDGLFAFNAEAGTIEMRSASRVGYWDLGANRRRLERLRTAWDAAQSL